MGNEIADKKLQFIGTNNDLKKEDMDSIIIKVDNERVILTDGTKSTITDLFSGCRVNFLFGAGFSANLLGTLSNKLSSAYKSNLKIDLPYISHLSKIVEVT